VRKVRVGIDVGGTFTDAVAIDDATYEIIASEKIPTTHAAAEGVSLGIITVLRRLIEAHHILPQEISFIAHGTTQATNALLEGDVAPVGILAMGYGIEAMRVEQDSRVGDIPLARGKSLHTFHAFVRTDWAPAQAAAICQNIEELHRQGAAVIVATEAFGVDHPENEEFVMAQAREMGLYATGGHEISQLYGLRVRTRTAVINGSLIPKMMETAHMTEMCVQQSGIKAQLMIMRCDGGVMGVREVHRRPILTMLSGLAAGVAGALMYEKLSDGIFLEAGGTSTDISAVRNGKVMVRYASVGGHKTYLNSLDVRTLGVAGGSMVRVDQGRISSVGPRSAHIAGLPYEVYSEPLIDPVLSYIAPCQGDEAVFAVVTGADGRCVALTLAGAANVAGFVPAGDYAAGDVAAARQAWQVLGQALGTTAESAARQTLDFAAVQIQKIVEDLIRDYHIPPAVLCLAGGGGSAGVIVPYLGERMHCRWNVVKNAPVISTIGVALAMVREVVERTIVQPTEDDIRSIRRAAMEQVLKSGASEPTVEISIEFDKQANILRAVAMGATDMRPRDAVQNVLTAKALRHTAAKAMQLPLEAVAEIAGTDAWHIFEGICRGKRFRVIPATRHYVYVLDRTGIVRLRCEACGVLVASIQNLAQELNEFIDLHTEYGTIGGQLPPMYAYVGEKQIDMSGLVNREQVDSVLAMELDGLPATEHIIIVAAK
jgi:N-methylhydantoinase A